MTEKRNKKKKILYITCHHTCHGYIDIDGLLKLKLLHKTHKHSFAKHKHFLYCLII